MTTTLSPPPPAGETTPPPGLTRPRDPVPNTPVLHRGQLLPGLHPSRWANSPGLSDDGFCDSFATIALSRELCAGLHCHDETGQHTVTVSQRGLSELELSTHRAWDLAAENLLRRAQEPEGTRFFTRPAHVLFGAGAPGLQIAVPGASPTAWLAHPYTFTVLHDHLSQLLDAEVRYLVFSSTVLVAAPVAAAGLEHLRWPGRRSGAGNPGSAGLLIAYEHGFPTRSGSAH